jgi:drug/metabolite transporter (DMT)-like permease
MEKHKDNAYLSSSLGMLFCFSAVFIWSFNAVLMRFGTTSFRPWQFIGIVSIISGLLHLLFRRVRYGEFRNAIFLPAKLWLITIFGFATCVLTFALAIATCKTEGDVCAVSLINYLWPTLTVLLGVVLVPNTRFSWKLVLALILSFTGLALANARQIPQIFMGNSTVSDMSPLRQMAPYLLALIAAVSWAAYSTLLARWRNWARQYTSCAMGMLIAGLVALVIGYFIEGPIEHPTTRGVMFMLLYALGPSAAGYLLWELAVSRTDVKTLGLVGALTPILSVFWICLFLRYLPGWELIAAVVLVSAGIILSRKT